MTYERPLYLRGQMPHVRGSEDGVCIPEGPHEHGRCFVRTQITSLVSHSHVAPAGWAAEFIRPTHLCFAALPSPSRLSIADHPASPPVSSPAEALGGTCRCVGDSSTASPVPALEQPVPSADPPWLLKSPAS